MKRASWIALALAAVAVALALLLWQQIRAGFPRVSGEVKLPGLSASARVVRDGHGIPHIDAQSERDGMVALGYVHAQDRLLQMEMMRRACRGTLAEAVGERAVEVDTLYRLLETERLARRNYQAAGTEVKAAVQAYALGVNAFLRSNPLPIELRLGGARPAPWEAWHSFCTPLLIGWVLGRNLAEELLALRLLRDGMERDKVCALMPSAPGARDPCDDHLRSFAGLEMGPPLRALDALRRLADGSNAWVVAPRRSRSGRALLASDPHLAISLPGIWYQADLTMDRWRIAGATIPGGPTFPIATNGPLAWGVTNAAADQVDLYVVRLDAKDPTRYLVGQQSRPIRKVPVTIAVRGGAPVTRALYHSELGPIVTEMTAKTRAAVVLRWAATFPDKSADSFRALARAETVDEAKSALAGMAMPALNFLLADGAGHIGWRVAGALPDRTGYSGRFPADGSSGVHEWAGPLPAELLPSFVDPAEGFLVNANNAPPEGASRVGHDFSGPWRARRLEQLLSVGKDLTSADLARMQMDVHSAMADAVLPGVLSTRVTDAGAVRAQDGLRAWDRQVRVESREATLFQFFLHEAARSIFADELGEALPEFLASLSFNYDALEDALLGGPAARFVGAGAVEQALARAWRRLPGGEGGRWGSVHYLRFRSSLGRASRILARFADRGPFPVAGDSDTVNVAPWTMADPFTVVAHASYRFAVDMGAPWAARAAHPTGQSGHPWHAHYDDLMPLWLRGETYRLPLEGADLTRATEAALVLRP